MSLFNLDEDRRYEGNDSNVQEYNRIEEGLENTKYDLFGSKRGVLKPTNLILLILTSLAVTAGMHMLFVQSTRMMFHAQDKIYLADAIAAIPTAPGIGMTVLCFLFFTYIAFSLKRGTDLNYSIDKTGKMVAKDDRAPYGHTREMSEKEEQKIFNRVENPLKMPGYEDILGYKIKNGKEVLYGFKPAGNESNKNMILFGEPGSGKTVFYAIQNIIQMAMRGVSIITTDSKGDLYKKTAWIMQNFFGYEVKILNVKPTELINSDGCDLLGIMKKGKNVDGKAQTIASTVIHNTEGSAFLDFWAKNELNLFKALILFVTHNQEMIAQHQDNLAGLYDYVTTKTIADISMDFGRLSKTDPARQAFNIFANCDPKVQGQILNGFQTRIEMLSNPDIKGVVSADEIDLTLPMKKRCIYYVVIADTESTYNFIANMFFAELFIELAEYADGLTEEEKDTILVPVTFLLDEFYSTGTIPEFEKKISTVRSRKIALTLILQDLAQLESMFPDNMHTTILNAIPTKLLLGTNDLETAKYFSDLMGEQTIVVEGERMVEHRADTVKVFPNRMKNDGFGKRKYMLPEEVIRKPRDEIIVIHRDQMPIHLKKWLSYNHPLIQQLCYNEDGSFKELLTTQHIPQWVKEKNAAEEEKQRKTEALRQMLLNKGIDPDAQPEEPANPEPKQNNSNNENGGNNGKGGQNGKNNNNKGGKKNNKKSKPNDAPAQTQPKPAPPKEEKEFIDMDSDEDALFGAFND